MTALEAFLAALILTMAYLMVMVQVGTVANYAITLITFALLLKLIKGR